LQIDAPGTDGHQRVPGGVVELPAEVRPHQVLLLGGRASRHLEKAEVPHEFRAEVTREIDFRMHGIEGSGMVLA
jgi:hypothetical protein